MRALVLVMVAFPAFAWDGNALWEEPANNFTGGSGVWGTGGKQDYGIQCSHCHMRPTGVTTPRIDLTFAFTPALESVGGAEGYKPGRVYSVTATMTGEWLGQSGCDPGMQNVNGFGAAFELANGTRAGRYQTDSGQDSNSCQPTTPDNNATGSFTTITYGRCHAVAYTGTPPRRSWTFTWTAPAAGSGPVTIYWGVVDGNCDMMSMGDDTKNGTKVLVEGMAVGPSRSGVARAAWAARTVKSTREQAVRWRLRLPAL